MRKEPINNVRRTRGKVRLDDLFERKNSIVHQSYQEMKKPPSENSAAHT